MPRMRARVTQPRESGHARTNCSQERGEFALVLERNGSQRVFEVRLTRPWCGWQRASRVAVAVHGLSEQRHFAHAGVHEALDLVHDLRGGAVALWTARIRHYAIRAALVAALHDCYECGGAGSPWLCTRAQ